MSLLLIGTTSYENVDLSVDEGLRRLCTTFCPELISFIVKNSAFLFQCEINVK